MKNSVRFFEDSKKLRMGLEDTRNKILQLLKIEDMSISQIAEALNKNNSTIFRHIKKLEEAGFVEVKGERKEHHIPEKIYGRTADVFLLSPEPMDMNIPLDLRWKEDSVKRCLELLYDIGFRCPEEVVDELTDFLKKVDIEITDDVGKSISDMDVDFFTMVQLRFLSTFVKIENDYSLKEEFNSIICKFERV